MSNPGLLLNKYLSNVYARIDKNDRALADFMQQVSNQIDSLGKEKLSVQEFHEFVDRFSKDLCDGLPSLEESGVPTDAISPKQELSSESNVDVKEGTVTILDQKTNGGALLKEESESLVTPKMPQELDTTECINFPMKVVGEVFNVGDGVTSVVGDAEIPSGTTVDATLVVKGNFKVGENCRLLRDVKVLNDISIGTNTKVEGNLVAGGKITLGSNCVVHGAIESDGDIEIDENTIVEGILRSKASIVLNTSAKALQTVYAAKGVSAQKATPNV